eukprot:g7646.t1
MFCEISTQACREIAKKRSLALRQRLYPAGITSDAGVIPGSFTPVSSESLKPVEEETELQSKPIFKHKINNAKNKCDVVDCGRFYCMKCQKEISRATELHLGMKPRTKDSFICPLHFCKICGSRESHENDILFPCRRCPVAFHERCMSRKLRDDPTRVWKAILKEDGTVSECSQVSCNFIYCPKHRTQNMMYGPEHDTDLFTPQIWKKWRIAYAYKFRSLNSSVPFLPQRRCGAFALGGGGPGRNLSDFAVAASVLGKGEGNSLTQTEAFLVDSQRVKRRRRRSLQTQEDLVESVNSMIKKGNEEVEKARDQVRGLIEDAMKEVSMDGVESELAQPFPYTISNSIRLTDERLDCFIRSVEQLEFDSKRIKESIPSTLVKKMERSLKAMRVSCAPFIFPNYTSFGRHFTKTTILEHVANHLIAYMKPNDLIVDFSCGSNEFLGIIKDFCRHNSFEIRVRAYDLFTPYRMDGFVKKSWFEVTPDELDHGDNLIIGLNPPFGVNASLANQFVNHAARMEPKLMLLICPPRTMVPENYKLIHEDHELCADKAFYIPGLRADQGNDITPPFRVLQRTK